MPIAIIIFLPLGNPLDANGRVGNLHIEERREHEGEEGHGGRTHKVEDGPEAGNRLRYEEKDKDADGTENASFPVKI